MKNLTKIENELLEVAKQAIEYLKDFNIKKPHFIKHAEKIIKTTAKEKRVYVVFANDVTNFYKMSKEKVIKHCEKTGNIYSLEGFENAINDEELYLGDAFIRIYDI